MKFGLELLGPEEANVPAGMAETDTRNPILASRAQMGLQDRSGGHSRQENCGGRAVVGAPGTEDSPRNRRLEYIRSL
jgi:hypothetical protein